MSQVFTLLAAPTSLTTDCDAIYSSRNEKVTLTLWGMAEEQNLKALQYSSNANDWEQWEQLVAQCDAEPASVDPRCGAVSRIGRVRYQQLPPRPRRL